MLVRAVAFEDLAPTIPSASSDDRDPAAFCLLIIGDTSVVTVPVPGSGRLVIGRAESCDVVIDEPQISREHAAIHAGAELELEDLGSANGTRLRGVKLEPFTRAVFAPGEAIDAGSTILIVQRASRASRKKKLASHSHLEARLEEEHHRTHASFALVRVRVEGRAPGGIVERVLTHHLGRGDVVAAYARGEYTILLLDTARSRAAAIAEKIRAELGEQKLESRTGIAVFPDDGSTPDALLESACAALRGGKSAADPRGIIIEDEAMRDLYRIVDRIALGTIAVLMLGETGSGKELLAEALHQRSRRSAGPFVRLNCAALTETLADSQLFGHEKGAFTGADKAKVGLLASADGGTVFLDEVGELPLSTQAKLLRAIEQREVVPVGGVAPVPIDVRFVAATNRDLEAEIAEGRFRRDLFYRLSGATLHVPPLRERTAEIAPLARAFVEKVSRELGIDPPPRISERAMELLEAYPWPGNIRELRNLIERSVLLAPGDRIEPEHLPLEKLNAVWTTRPRRGEEDGERARILDALDRCAGNQTRAAELLGVSRRTLTKWLTRHQLPRPRKRDA